MSNAVDGRLSWIKSRSGEPFTTIPAPRRQSRPMPAIDSTIASATTFEAPPPLREPVKVSFQDPLLTSASTRTETEPRRGTGFLEYRYRVTPTLTVGSEVPLKELEFFADHRVGHDMDIEIRIGRVGKGSLRKRAQLLRFSGPDGIRYEEHLGRFGANFAIDLGDRIHVTISPLLARSPHVAYTNIVEALLRFALASRGQMLLHSACMEVNGVGVMLSAKTDTGKTGTVLRMLREHRARFLSDDMTIVNTDGTVSCYPKPLTISSHTLRAVDPGDLSKAEWLMLGLKSRIHSKGGRGVGLWMGQANLPIMSANAVTQILVPPPKYDADRLVRCDVIEQTTVKNLFIIERGGSHLEDVPKQDAIDELMANTEDAYGFPPFRFLAPVLVIGGEEHAALMVREREILDSALDHIRVRRLGSDCFGWADEIPKLLANDAADEVRR